MNETITHILARRSVRRFKPDQIPQADLELVIQAGLYAPSARNRQPWHLTVLRGQETIGKLNEQVKAATARMPENHYKEMVASSGYTINFHAPTFVIVSGDTSVATAEVDCGLVLQNMFLAAHSLGIGSCWVNQLGILSDEPGFREVLNGLRIPSSFRIMGCAALGYPETGFPKAPARKEGNVVYHGEA